MPLVGELDFTRTQVVSFLMLCWQLSFLVWVGLEIKGLELEPGVRQNFPSAHSHHCPIRGGIWSQVTGAEALRVEPRLALFPLSVCFLLFYYHDPCPRGRDCWMMGACAGSQIVLATDRSPSCLPCAASADANMVSLHSAQMQPWIQVPFVPHSWSHLPAPITFTLLWSCTAGQVGPAWTLGVHWSMSCDGPVAIRVLGCFWWAAWEASTMASAVQKLTLNQVASVSSGQAFFPVVAVLDPMLHCNVE